MAFLIAISFNGHIFAGTDSVGGAGDVYRSTANKRSWVEINRDEITVDVRVLGDQCERSHFAGTFAGGTAGGIFRSGRDGDS